MPPPHEVSVERGAKRVFAGANEWPGWCRSGRTEEAALEALLAYGPRYAKALGERRLGFVAPADVIGLRVVERRTGNATTDLGAPAIAPHADDRPIDEEEAARLAAIMKACWGALDRAAEGDARTAVLAAFASRARGEPPQRTPRSGGLWPPRYFIRRAAWHALHHAWEIETVRGRRREPVRFAAQRLHPYPSDASVVRLKRSPLRPKPFGKDLPERPGPWTQQNCSATRWSGERATST